MNDNPPPNNAEAQALADLISGEVQRQLEPVVERLERSNAELTQQVGQQMNAVQQEVAQLGQRPLLLDTIQRAAQILETRGGNR
jgi:hypothetical protein